MSWLALAGAVIGAGASIYSQKRQESARDKQIRDILNRYSRLKSEANASGSAAMSYLTTAQGRIDQSFGEAQGFLKQTSRGAEINALDQQRQLMAQMERDLISRGSYSTDALKWGRLGIGERTQRVLADIAGRTNDALASLSVQHGQSTASIDALKAQQQNVNFQNALGIGGGQIQAVGADYPQANSYAKEIGYLFNSLDKLWTGEDKKTEVNVSTSSTTPKDPYSPPADSPTGSRSTWGGVDIEMNRQNRGPVA